MNNVTATEIEQRLEALRFLADKWLQLLIEDLSRRIGAILEERKDVK